MVKKYMPNHYDFLMAPEQHHAVWKLIVLIVILVVLVLAGWLYSYLFMGQSVAPHPQPAAPAPHVLTDAERSAIMSKPSGVPANTSLTDAQRRAIMSKPAK